MHSFLAATYVWCSVVHRFLVFILGRVFCFLFRKLYPVIKFSSSMSLDRPGNWTNVCGSVHPWGSNFTSPLTVRRFIAWAQLSKPIIKIRTGNSRKFSVFALLDDNQCSSLGLFTFITIGCCFDFFLLFFWHFSSPFFFLSVFLSLNSHFPWFPLLASLILASSHLMLREWH